MRRLYQNKTRTLEEDGFDRASFLLDGNAIVVDCMGSLEEDKYFISIYVEQVLPGPTEYERDEYGTDPEYTEVIYTKRTKKSQKMYISSWEDFLNRPESYIMRILL